MTAPASQSLQSTWKAPSVQWRSVRPALVLGLFLWSGCGDGSSFIQVTVRSDSSVLLTSLEVDATNASQTAHVSVVRGAGFSVPPDQSFTLKFDPSRRGLVTIEVA